MARLQNQETRLADELVTALAGLKQTYLKVCEGYADSVGMDVGELLSRIERRVKDAPLGD